MWLIPMAIYKAEYQSSSSKIASLNIENDKTNHNSVNHIKSIQDSILKTKHTITNQNPTQNGLISKYNVKGKYV